MKVHKLEKERETETEREREKAIHLSHKIFCILGRSEPPPSLLIHLSSRSNSIDGHEEKFLWLDYPEQNLQVVKYVTEDLLLRDSE